ncbi:unnamed protein product [Aphanomyces euteiches]
MKDQLNWTDVGWTSVWYMYTMLVVAMLYYAWPTLLKMPLFFTKDYQMVDAASCGNIEGVRRLLAQGANVNWTMGEIMGDPLTAVYWASVNGDADVVELLLDKHADPDIETKSGYTALTAAAELGDAKIVKLLAEHHADIDHTDKAGETALMRASSYGHTDVVRLLLAKKAAVDTTDKLVRNTALMIAAWHGHANIIKLLLPKANLALTNQDGQTARQIALDRGHTECAELLA